MKASFLIVILIAVFTVSSKAQTWQDPNAAYWNEFNRSTNGVYKVANASNRLMGRTVNVVSRRIPVAGTGIRLTYNAANRFIQRNVGLPRYYQPR